MTALPFALSLVEPTMLDLAVRPRSARVADASEIHRLITLWSGQGLTIPRPAGEILGSIGDFIVARRVPDGRVVACGALEMVTGSVAEIRSISVDPAAPRIGAGRVVVRSLLAEASERGVDRVVLLTKTPDFFARCGFAAVPADDLPPAYAGPHLHARDRTTVGRIAMSIELGRDTVLPA
ncbi:MAG: GNAT family N-acetyltransferase [Planctomycetota bacterium]